MNQDRTYRSWRDLLPRTGINCDRCRRFLTVSKMIKTSASRTAKIFWGPALASLLLVALTASAQADPKLLKAAQDLLAANNPKQAYMLLVAEQDRYAGDIEFDYLLGVSSLDSGKIDEAIIAFERVLAVNPKHAGAQMDLARAYYTAGSLDLAEGTFKQLKESHPPAIALMAIDRYLEAIAEQRKKRRRILAAWGEMSLGYDSNLTGVPRDFSSAVASSFNLQGISPTGNSIERKAPYLGAALGVDYTVPITRTWSGFAAGEVHERAYRKESAFRSTSVDGRAGVAWTSDAHQLRFGVSGNRFDQEGAAPGDPKPTNDRRSGMASADYRYALTDRQQVSFGINAARTHFPANDVEDFNSTIATLGWIRAFDAKNAPLADQHFLQSRQGGPQTGRRPYRQVEGRVRIARLLPDFADRETRCLHQRRLYRTQGQGCLRPRHAGGNRQRQDVRCDAGAQLEVPEELRIARAMVLLAQQFQHRHLRIFA